MPEIPRGPTAIVDLVCGRRYRSFHRYLEHAIAHLITQRDLEQATVEGTPGEGFWWTLPNGHTVLVAQPMTAKGEPVRPEDRERMLEQEPGHVLRSQDVNDTLAMCDICGDRPIYAVYSARRFIGPAGGMMGGPTALCKACDILHQRGDAVRILKRVLRRLPGPAPAGPLMAMLETLFANFTGRRVLIGSRP